MAEIADKCKTAKFRIATKDSADISRRVEFDGSIARKEITATGKVTTATVECCGKALAFGNEEKKYVELPKTVQCIECSAIYGINKVNTAKIELRGHYKA